MNEDSILEPCFRLCLELPNGAEASVAIPPSELKRILIALGERDYLCSRAVEMLLVSLSLEEA